MKPISIKQVEKILDSINAQIYVTVPETGELLFVNKKLRIDAGRENDSFAGEFCYNVFRGLDKMCEFCPRPALDKNPEEMVVWEEYVEHFDKYVIHSDSYIDWPDGRKVHLQHISDITDISRTQEQLTDQNLRLNLLVGGLDVALWDCQIDPKAKTTEDMLSPDAKMWYSDGIRKMYGYEDESDFPNTMGAWFSNIHPDDVQAVYTQVLAHLDDPTNKTPFNIELRMRMKNGNYKWVRIFGSTLRDENGKPLKASGATEDISKRKESEREIEEKNAQLEIALNKAEAANKAKSEFLAKMSHEIRTPMNAIIGMTELALREDAHDGRTEHMLAVKQAGANLLAIINEILDFSKIEAGKMELVSKDYSVAALLNDLISLIRMKAAESRIRLFVKADSNIPQTLYGDETKIRQAVLNILINAVKYTDNGFVGLSVYKKESDSAEPYLKQADEKTINLVFEIEDSGIGIKPEDMEKLFTDFTQVDIERNRGIEGVGLGLTIARSIVKKMGGDITVISEYGKGSTFTITIPQKVSSSKALAKLKSKKAKSILIYERRDVYADSLSYTLKNLGVDHTFVTSGTKLYEAMESRAYDFLLIAFSLYTKNEDTILKFGKDTKTVILTEFGEAMPQGHQNVISMPVYCVQIASLIDGISGKSADGGKKEPIVRFTAPHAKVLIVDDVNTNLKVTQGLLLPYNMRITLCDNGFAAIENVKAKDYDLVFMDHKMPNIDGIEATRIIREMGKTDAYFSELPIIALTANAVSGAEKLYYENGFNGFLAKPIDTVELNAILEKWIPQNKQEEFTALAE